MALTIWQLDPANLTPYYNLAICQALAQAGQQVRYITSRYLYDKHLPISQQFTVEYPYFRGISQQWLLKTPRLRKLLRGLSYPINHWQVLQKIKHHQPDIIHIQWSRLPRFDLSFIRAIKKLNRPVVHTIHNVRSSFATDDDITQLGKVYHLCDQIILHTYANQQAFLALYPDISVDKTTVIPMIHAPSHIPNHPYPTRHLFQLTKEHFVFLFFGIIRQYKGLDLLLEAFRQIHKQYPHARLLIAGKPETQSDLQLIYSAKNQPGVIVREGFIPADILWQYFAAADISVFPYRYVTQSAALIQAMEFGKPVIVTDVGGLAEVIDNNGWIVPSITVENLTQTMIDALNTPEQTRLIMGARSAEIVATHHNSQAIAQKLVACYQRLI
ncbi:MAG: glycosyltransferase family 1 protein [Chloroflexi bacterium]|nr:MAG: glycosyltransferase family 1 protein [Chloroflexota bacterium]